MKTISLKKLGLYSLSLLTLCFMGLANQAEAACGSKAIFDHGSKKSSKCNDPRRTEAIVLSTDIINTFANRFSAAVRAPFGSEEQIALVQELEKTLDTKGGYSIIFVFGGVPFPAVTNFDELLSLVQSQAGVFDSSLTGNIEVECYRDHHGRRTLQLKALEYVVQTPFSSTQSNLIIASDQYTVVETGTKSRDNCERCKYQFQIQSLVATVLTIIPLGPCTPCNL